MEELLSLKNIIKDGNNFKLQNNYYKDGESILSVIPFDQRDDHNCELCSHFTRMTEYDGYCNIYNNLLGLKDNAFAWTSSIINCFAYNKIERLNIIKTLDDMIAFIEKTKNFFRCSEDYEEYYGFKRDYDEENDEFTESVREYYERGGTFTNIPTQYPCVIYFNYGKNNLEWVCIGE